MDEMHRKSHREPGQRADQRSGQGPRDAADGVAPGERLPLSPAVMHVLLSLADAERHGYAISKEVERRTGGATRMGPGTLYGSIKRMLAEGFIEESDERPDPALDDRRRRYYRITDHGRRTIGAEMRRLDALVGVAREKRLLPSLPDAGSGPVPEGA